VPGQALKGVRVIVAGAGLAGLTAARELSRQGAVVRVVEARDRIGGRVWTFRDQPIAPFHADLGGEFIDRDHKAIRRLCREFDLPLVRVLRRGFGLAIDVQRRMRVLTRQRELWKALTAALEPAAKAFDAAGRSWSSSEAAAIARRSVRDMLLAARASPRSHAHATAMRGLVLAEPEELAALVMVEETLEGDDPSRVPIYRIEGGADRLATALRDDAKCRLDLRHRVRAVEQLGDHVEVTIESSSGRRARARADYLIAAVPSPLLGDWHFTPALGDMQREAFSLLRFGPATKAVLRFDTRWWRQPGRPRAFATNLPVGAVWETAEDQRKAPLLTLLAGARASGELTEILRREGAAGVTRRLRWLGGGTKEPASVQAVTWEDDPWARGGYEYFHKGFDPALRDSLSRAHGRVLFAGAHTSRDHQGYMNGAVESGQRAAGEVERLRQLLTP
jgi:monoamine oxidase